MVLSGGLIGFGLFAVWLIIRVLVFELGVTDRSTVVCKQYQTRRPEMLLIFLCAVGLVAVSFFQFDFLVADWIYDETHWVLKKSFLANGLLHKLAKICLMIVYLYLWYTVAKAYRNSGNIQQGYHLMVMLLSVGLSVAVVSILKRFLDVDCPWDLLRYGGDKPFFSLFNYNPAFLPSANCFPSSHASVGYSWIAVYFYMSVTHNPLKYKALIAVLVLGLLFGITQQLRGAHFVSHDLTSLLICTGVAVLVYTITYRNRKPVENV